VLEITVNTQKKPPLHLATVRCTSAMEKQLKTITKEENIKEIRMESSWRKGSHGPIEPQKEGQSHLSKTVITAGGGGKSLFPQLSGIKKIPWKTYVRKNS